MDAMTSVGLCYYVDCNIRECGGVWQGDSDAIDVPSYKELIFTVDEKILNAIDTAEISYNALVGLLFCRDFTVFYFYTCVLVKSFQSVCS